MSRRLALVFLLLGLSACTPVPDPAPTGRPLVSVSDDVRGAYLAYWSAWEIASRTAEPDHPGLAEHVGLPLLETLQANLASARARNQVTRGTVQHHLRGMFVEPDLRRIVDCVDLDAWLLYDATTGAQLDQLTDKPSQLTVTWMRQGPHGWQATNIYPEGDCS